MDDRDLQAALHKCLLNVGLKDHGGFVIRVSGRIAASASNDIATRKAIREELRSYPVGQRGGLSVELLTELLAGAISKAGAVWPLKDWFRIGSYLKKYERIAAATVTGDDIAKLFQMNDAQLREKLSRLIKNVDTVVSARESRKPHGPAEIGDMDIPFRHNGEQYFLSLVVKSGQEVKGRVLEEKFLGQVVRPFTHFNGKCIVILVTAKKCSENLQSSIKRLSSALNYRVHVVQEAELAALLKVNGVL